MIDLQEILTKKEIDNIEIKREIYNNKAEYYVNVVGSAFATIASAGYIFIAQNNLLNLSQQDDFRAYACIGLSTLFGILTFSFLKSAKNHKNKINELEAQLN